MSEHERPQPEARGAVDDPRQDHPTAPPAAMTVQPEAMMDIRVDRFVTGSALLPMPDLARPRRELD